MARNLGSKTATSLRGRASGNLPPTVACSEAGHALVLHLGAAPERATVALANRVVDDPEHTVVFVDLPREALPELWDAAAALLAKRKGGFRLVLHGQPKGIKGATGQWFAERLRRTIVASDAPPVLVPGGTLFVPPDLGAGWVRYRRGRAATTESRRFPTPQWAHPSVERMWSVGPDAVAEPLAGGVWLHRRHPDSARCGYRHTLVRTLPMRSDELAVVLGCPGTPPLTLGDIAMFWSALPAELRRMVRFVRYGQVARPEGATLGQVLANLLNYSAILYSGLPTAEGAIRAVAENGGLGWQPYALELGYAPTGADGGPAGPRVLAHRCPLPNALRVGPAAYQLDHDAVVEVVQSGLWLRPPEVPRNAASVRTMAADPMRPQVIFQAGQYYSDGRIKELVRGALAQLEPGVRNSCKVLPAPSTSKATPPPVRPAEVTSPTLATALAAPNPTTVLGGGTEVTTRLMPKRRRTAEPAAVEHPPALPATTTVSAPTETGRSAYLTEHDLPADEAIASGDSPAGTMVDVSAVDSLEVAAAPKTTLAPAAMPIGLRLESVEPDLAVFPSFATQLAGTATAGAGVAPAADTPALKLTAAALPELRPGVAVVDQPLAEPETVVDEDAARIVERLDRDALAARPPVAATVLVQRVPVAEASALPPERGLESERDWLRRTLSSEFANSASSVSRLLSQMPGLRAGQQTDTVLVDLVAVQMYLESGSTALSDAVRDAEPGPHVPLARCVSAGLLRLPSYRGAARLRARTSKAQLDWFRERHLVTEWGFLHATMGGEPASADEVEFRIWSMTARRTALLHPDRPNQVIFQPGTSFKVLRIEEGDSAPVVLLRELSKAEIDPDGRVDITRVPIDDLSLAGLEQAAAAWQADQKPVPDSTVADAPPGLLVQASAGPSERDGEGAGR